MLGGSGGGGGCECWVLMREMDIVESDGERKDDGDNKDNWNTAV